MEMDQRARPRPPSPLSLPSWSSLLNGAEAASDDLIAALEVTEEVSQPIRPIVAPFPFHLHLLLVRALAYAGP